jgi:myosin heavy subunit
MEATLLTDLQLHEVSLVKRGANQGAKLALVKQLEKEDNKMEELETKVSDLTKALEEATAEIAKSKEELEAAQATIAELSKEDEVEVEEINKTELPESVVKQLEEADKVSKEFAEFKEKAILKDLEARVDEHDAVFKSDEEKAEAVDVLKSMTEKERDFMFSTVIKASQIVKEAADTISQEVGKNGDNEVSVSESVEKEAKNYASEHNVTIEKARVEIVSKLSVDERAKYNKGE